LHKLNFSALIVVPESSYLYTSGHLYTQPRQTSIPYLIFSRDEGNWKKTEMRSEKSVTMENIQNSIQRYILNPEYRKINLPYLTIQLLPRSKSVNATGPALGLLDPFDAIGLRAYVSPAITRDSRITNF
jgi:hypothetical protein